MRLWGKHLGQMTADGEQVLYVFDPAFEYLQELSHL